MKISRVIFLILFCAGASSSAFAQEIRGRVTDAKGGALSGAAVVVQRNGVAAQLTQTAQDGNYALPALMPGSYMVVVQKAGFAEQRQGPIEVSPDGPAPVVNFRLAEAAEAEAVRGSEERNPNDFVIRLDNNSISNELIRTGATLRFIPEFRSDRSYYGEPYGYALKNVDTAPLGSVLRGFHGSVFEFHQNHVLNARPFFQVGALLPSRRNQYGFSVSGPILKDKLSFGFAWGQVRDSGFVNGNVQVPLADERTPRTTDPSQYALIAALLKAYPDQLPNLPQVSKRHLNTNAFRDIHSTAFSTHLDARVGSEGRLAFDQQFSDVTEDPFELVIGQNPQTFTRPQTLHLTYSRVLSPRSTLQVIANYDRLGALLLPTKRYQALLSSLNVPQVPDFDMGDELSNIGLPGQGILRKRFENHYLLGAQASRSAGGHNFSAGFTSKHLWDSDQRSSNGRGTLLFNRDTFTDPITGQQSTTSAVENFLLGQATRLSLTVGNQYRGYRNWEWSAYFQDRFALRKSLQLTYGLRYEALTVPYEVSHSFEFQNDTDANNFAPQLGFAWSPPLGGIVVRGGYGVVFGSLTLATWNRQAGNPPLTQSLSVDHPTIDVVYIIPSLVPDPSRKSGLGMLDEDAALPYSHVYNLSLERGLPGAMLLRVGYQGSRTYKMFAGIGQNRARNVAGMVATSANVNARRPDQRYLRVYDVMGGSTGYHDGLQVSLAKRRTRGLSFEVRYSFSKTLDSGISGFADTGNGGDVAQSEELVSDVKSFSSFDTPHSMTMIYSYEIPSLPAGPGWLSSMVRRWTVSGTTTFRSGTPFAVYTGSDGPGSGNIDGEASDRPNLLDPSILGRSFDNPDTSPALMGADTCDDVVLSSTTTYRRCRYFDTNLPVGGRGTVGYRVFRKDGTNNWNLALGRSFAIPGAGGERQLQFRAEFYNFLNHAQFAAPGNSISSPTFGQITNTVNKGRVTQFSLRFQF